MKKRKITVIILFVFVLSITVMVMGGSLRAESTSDTYKLDQILQQQKEILQEINSIKGELQIIKQNTNRC